MISHDLLGGWVDCEFKSTSEPNKSEYPERIIRKCLEGLHGGANQFRLHIRQPSCVILHLAGIQVEKQSVHSRVPPQGILFGRAELHLWVSAVLRVRLLAEVDEVHIVAEQLDRSRLQVLGFVGVPGNFVQVPDIGLRDAMLLSRLRLLAELADLQSESLPGHNVDGSINVVRLDAQELISHPATSPAQNDGLRTRRLVLVHISGNIQEQVLELLLFGA